MNRTENALRLVSDYLKINTCQYPDKTAFVFNEQRISYQEFSEKTKRLAGFLLKLGVKKQDKLVYLFETQPEFFYLSMAASRIGAIVVGMGTRLMPPELEYIINDSQATLIFVTGGDKPYVDKIKDILPNCSSVKKVIVAGNQAGDPDFLSFEDIFTDRYSEFDRLLEEREAEVDTRDGLLMVYTSGTTGSPKGVLLSHRNIIHSGLIEVDEFKSTSDDIWLNNMPVNHVGGAIVQGMTPLLTAATVVLLASFSPTKTLELIQKEKVTLLGGVPTMYAMELNLPDYDDYDKSSLRCVHFGASMVPKNTLEKVFSTMCANVYNCLGMTEAAGIVTYTPQGLDADLLSKSVGRVIPEAEWKLVDKNRQPVQTGEVGEIAYRGSTIITGYYHKAQVTAEHIDEEGWFYAGDLLYEDENGLLHLMGRKKEMFVTGGENVYSCEVEGAICGYEQVEAVAVVPMPDPIYGDIGYAYIVSKPGCKINEADLQDYLKGKLAKYKIPAKFIFRDALPLNPSGKIAKKVLRQEIAAAMNNQPGC